MQISIAILLMLFSLVRLKAQQQQSKLDDVEQRLALSSDAYVEYRREKLLKERTTMRNNAIQLMVFCLATCAFILYVYFSTRPDAPIWPVLVAIGPLLIYTGGFVVHYSRKYADQDAWSKRVEFQLWKERRNRHE